MQQKPIGLRFITRVGTYLNVALDEQTANRIIKEWHAGGNNRIGGISLAYGPMPAMAFGVESKEISVVHTFDLETLLQQNQQRDTNSLSGYPWHGSQN